MKATVFDTQKGRFEVSVDELLHRLPKESFFWLDVESPTGEELQVVAGALEIYEPILSWLGRFGHRARVEAGDQQARISTWGLGVSGNPVPVHALFRPAWILTVHEGASVGMERARGMFKRFIKSAGPQNFGGLLLILGELAQSFDALIERLDEELNALEEQVLQAPREGHVEQLMRMRRQFWSLHRMWEPLENSARELASSMKALPEMAERATLTSDYAEHLGDLVDRIDDLRQRATEAMEAYGTSISNKQSQIINRLTILSAVFLPLTFLTGVFGMNFQWMIERLQSLGAFLALGVGLFLGVLIGTLTLFRSRGWLGERSPERPATGAASSLPGTAPDVSGGITEGHAASRS